MIGRIIPMIDQSRVEARASVACDGHRLGATLAIMQLCSGILLAACALIGCAPAAAPRPVPLLPPARFMAASGAAGVAGSGLDPSDRAKVLAALPAVEKHFLAQFEKQKLAGLAVGIVLGGELVHGRGFGVRDMASKAPVDVDTVFRIASLTKSFTAMAVLKLRDEGRLSLDDPADRYIPELAAVAYPTRDSARITIRQLLTHSAGFPEDNPWGDRPADLDETGFARMLAKGLSFSSPPNTAFE
jgi:CubicO group peptidase (beta-lactamase class C family)